METTRLGGRAVALALTVAGLTAFTSTGAAACGPDYSIQPGDTLGAIAARCDTTVAALTAANKVDPRNLKLGQVLAIPGMAEGDEPVMRESARRTDAVADADTADAVEGVPGYRVERGDTLAGIARKLGVEESALEAANPGLDPRRMKIGQAVRVPDTEKVRDLLAEREAEKQKLTEMQEEYANPKLWAADGEWRRTVDLEAAGLAPGETVRIAVSDGNGEWITLGDMKAGDDGELEARARIPAEFQASQLTFAMQRPWGEHVAIDYREGDTATARRERSGDDTDYAKAETGEEIAVAGKVVRGGDCSLLVTPEGNFAVANAEALEPGAEVEVIGRRGESVAGCTGAQAAIEVAVVRLL